MKQEHNYLTTKNSKVFPSILVIFLLIYVVEYVAVVAFNESPFSHPAMMDVSIAIVCSFWYLVRYRRDKLLCFELMFLPIFIIGSFYSDIVLSTLNFSIDGVGGAFRNAIIDTTIVNKSRLVQMITLFVFMLGCIIGHKQEREASSTWILPNEYLRVNYGAIIKILVILLLAEVLKNYLNGNFSTWFSYGSGVADNERNQGLGHIDSLCLLSTVVEFTRLASLGVASARQFLSKVNRLYLLEIIIVSLLLILSGNRNEMLLICLPVVVAYSIFVKQIPNKYILLGLALGLVVMVYSGLTRQGDTISMSDIDLYSITRDFSLVQINCDYLVKYTDDGHLHLFSTLPASLLGGIPYLGPVIFNALGLDLTSQSAYITTEGLAAWEGTGLGTSLVGDLYYNAKLPFVIVFMSLFGYAISRMHIRFLVERRYSLLYVLIYLYIVSNAVYFVRQQWDFPISRIMYCFIILVVLYKIFNKPHLI